MALAPLAPLMSKALTTPKGRAAAIALAPFVVVALVVGFGYVSSAQLSEKASCVMECQCARSYVIGALALWALGIQAALKSAPKAPPKDGEAECATDKAPLPTVPKGKVAAKAA